MSDTFTTSEVDLIHDALSAYVAEHPEAQATADGINAKLIDSADPVRAAAETLVQVADVERCGWYDLEIRNLREALAAA